MYHSATDDLALEKAFNAILHCAKIAAKHHMQTVLDDLIQAIVNLTTLTGFGTGVKEHKIVEIDKEKIPVSRIAVRFGQNYKGQLAMILLFAIVRENVQELQKSWVYVILIFTHLLQIWDIVKTLFCCALLPDGLMETEDLINGNSMLIPLKIDNPKPESLNKDGWFSYLLPAYSETVWEPTEGELEYSRRSYICVLSCHLEELFKSER